MPSITSAVFLRIQCVNADCSTEVLYQLQTKRPLPTCCPVCNNSWGDGIQAFRDALDAQRSNGARKYNLHLEFGAEPFSVVVP